MTVKMTKEIGKALVTLRDAARGPRMAPAIGDRHSSNPEMVEIVAAPNADQVKAAKYLLEGMTGLELYEAIASSYRDGLRTEYFS